MEFIVNKTYETPNKHIVTFKRYDEHNDPCFVIVTRNNFIRNSDGTVAFIKYQATLFKLWQINTHRPELVKPLTF